MGVKVCVKWAEESFEECTQWADQGYSSCDNWDAQCCTWAPCSWFCDLITWICVAWVWISNVVCISWAITTTVVCVAWESLATVLAPVAVLIEWILSIPIIGRLINAVLNLASAIIKRIVSFPEVIPGLVGIRPLKKVRLCFIILRDEQGNALATESDLEAEIAAAQKIWREEANLEMIVDGIHTVRHPSPTYALDVQCNAEEWAHDFWLTGGYFERAAAWFCPTGALGRILGFAKPIVVFRVREISGALGCTLFGPQVDYITIDDTTRYLSCVTLAHEIGHKLGLWHCCDTSNLMNASACNGPMLQLNDVQVVTARNSEHASFV